MIIPLRVALVMAASARVAGASPRTSRVKARRSLRAWGARLPWMPFQPAGDSYGLRLAHANPSSPRPRRGDLFHYLGARSSRSVASRVQTWWRHAGGQAAQHRQRVHVHRHRPVAVRLLQNDAHQAVGAVALVGVWRGGWREGSGHDPRHGRGACHPGCLGGLWLSGWRQP